MHNSEFQPKYELLTSIRGDAHNATLACVEQDHPGHDWDTCPHREVFHKAVKELDQLFKAYLATPIRERYS